MTVAIARALVCALVIAGTLTLACDPAGADVFKAIELDSSGFLGGGEGGLQQALYAHDPAISGNGRYVAFDGYFGGRTGVWRRDLETGEVQPVAVGVEVPGSNESCVEQQPCDAELPSISENGQYVTFTTAAPLAPTLDRNDAPDVYLRDMNVPESQPCEEVLHPRQPCAYTLVSAVNGKAEGLSYEGARVFGAVAAGRSAISATGEEVAFVTTAVSNLAACQTGTPPEGACQEDSSESPPVDTPALQVAVRNWKTGETQLVSVEYDPATGQPIPDAPVSAVEGDVSYGAVYSASGGAPEFPFANHRAYNLPTTIGASISANGTTVAWMATDVYKQARMLPDESVDPHYTEPLWRRISDGPLAPIRRVTGGSEPENPACAASGETNVQGNETASNPCLGPFAVEPDYGIWAGTYGDAVPQLSADGDEVAFLATAKLVSLGIDFGHGGESPLDDLYLANMQEGLTRTQALRPLTQLVNGVEGEQPIVDVAISADGNLVAFSTQRTVFPLGSPAFISQPAAVVGMAELFDADLVDNTLVRVTGGYEGGPAEHPYEKATTTEERYKTRADGALSPSFSTDGNVLAFSDTASNLVYGDGNTPPLSAALPTDNSDGSDVFDAKRELFQAEPAATYISPETGNPTITPLWSLGVTALSLKNGTVRLYVETPGTGKLSASADSAIKLVAAAPAGARAKRDGAGAKRARAGNAARAHATSATRGHAAVAERDVSSASKAIAASTGGLAELTLTLASRYRALARERGGLAASVSVAFSAPGHKTLKQSIAVTFVTSAKRPAGKNKAKKAKNSSRAAKRASSPARRAR